MKCLALALHEYFRDFYEIMRDPEAVEKYEKLIAVHKTVCSQCIQEQKNDVEVLKP